MITGIDVRFSEKQVFDTINKLEEDIDKANSASLLKVSEYAKQLVILVAPMDRGYLRASIIKKIMSNTRRNKEFIITVRGDKDTKRAARFANTTYGSFVNYLHKNSKLLTASGKEKNFHGKIRDFLTNDWVHQNVSNELEKVGIENIRTYLRI